MRGPTINGIDYTSIQSITSFVSNKESISLESTDDFFLLKSKLVNQRRKFSQQDLCIDLAMSISVYFAYIDWKLESWGDMSLTVEVDTIFILSEDDYFLYKFNHRYQSLNITFKYRYEAEYLYELVGKMSRQPLLESLNIFAFGCAQLSCSIVAHSALYDCSVPQANLFINDTQNTGLTHNQRIQQFICYSYLLL